MGVAYDDSVDTGFLVNMGTEHDKFVEQRAQ